MKWVLLAILTFFWFAGEVWADACPGGQTCYGARTVNEWVCGTSGGGACTTGCGACANWPGKGCDPRGDGSDCEDAHHLNGSCVPVCCGNVGSGGECVAQSVNVGCSETANSCSASGMVYQCTDSTSSCVQTRSLEEYGCCGPGGGGGGGGGGGSTHAECQSQSCVSVSGAGADECSVDADCAPPPAVTHLECQSNACVVVAGAGADQCATDPDCVTTYSVSGSVYLDNSGTCSDTSTPLLPGAGSVVTSSGLPDTAVGGGGGAYSMGGVLGGTRVFTLSSTDPQYVCSCPSGCSESVNVTGNTTINYFVTNVQGDWWQTRGGDVGANNGSISSNIPSTCVGTCKPYLSLYDGSPSDWPRSERSRVGF